MGVQSTRYIKRSEAIERILEIQDLVREIDYKGIEDASFEPNCDLASFVEAELSKNHFIKKTNGMLGDLMYRPFYRYSMFENYIVQDD